MLLSLISSAYSMFKSLIYRRLSSCLASQIPIYQIVGDALGQPSCWQID